MQVGKYREYHITFSRYVCQMIGGALNMHPIYVWIFWGLPVWCGGAVGLCEPPREVTMGPRASQLLYGNA